jgi:hypothetical protein
MHFEQVLREVGCVEQSKVENSNLVWDNDSFILYSTLNCCYVFELIHHIMFAHLLEFEFTLQQHSVSGYSL